MTITNMDGVVAGLQNTHPFLKQAPSSGAYVIGRYHSSWYYNGNPGGGVASAGANGNVRSSSSGLIAGQIPFFDPGSGSSYLARFSVASSGPGCVWLVDRLWDCYSTTAPALFSPTSTSSQTVTSATWPSRDDNGATAGVGVFVALEVQASLGSGTPTFTLTYTNSAGTGSLTAITTQLTTASPPGTTHQFPLNAGDVGVGSVQSIQASATQASGQWGLVAYRVLGQVELTTAGCGGALDLMTGGFKQMYNGTVPFIMVVPDTAGPLSYYGSMTVVRG